LRLRTALPRTRWPTPPVLGAQSRRAGLGVPDIQDLADGPEAQAMQVELAGRMATLLDMLPEKQREIIRLRVVVGLSAEETTEAVGSTPGAVRVAQHRTLSRLRSLVGSEGVA
jgi:RNA polymerase sigma-70 factor (ECF subfamily)